MNTSDNEIKRPHSLTKVLPSVGNFSFLGTSPKIIERSNSVNESMTNNQSLFIQEYVLCSEFNLLKYHSEPGMYVIPAAKNPFIWFGVVFIRNGIYEGGIFRFRLFIPQTFPDCTVCPKVIFETPVFHPLVDPTTDEINLKETTTFSEWKKDVNHLWQIISYIRSIFYEISITNPTNKRAANLYETDKDEFIKLVKECVESSKIKIYEKPLEDDPHYLIFDEYNTQIHQTFKESILKEKINSRESNDSRSISWVQAGSLEPLSKQDLG